MAKELLQQHLFRVHNKILIIFFALFCLNIVCGCSDAIREWVSSGTGAAPGAPSVAPLEKTSTWDFSDPNKYTFGGQYVAVSNGKVSLKQVDQQHSGADFNSGSHVGTYVDGNGKLVLKSSGNDSVALSWAPDNTNIVGHYNFNNNYADSISSGPSWTITGDPEFLTPGKLGTHLIDLDGGDDRLNAFGFTAFNSSFTIAFWIKSNSATSNEAIFYHGNSGVDGFRIIHNNNKIAALTTSEGGSLYIESSTLSIGKWYHAVVALNLTNNSGKMYIDGELAESKTGIINGSVGVNARLGWGPGINYFHGSIDELTIWSSTLSLTQAQTIYNKQSERYAENTSLHSSWTPKYNNIVGYWKMDGNWLDSSGNGNHGTSFGGATFSSIRKIGSQSGIFDGSSEYILIPHSSSIDPQQNLTIQAWINPVSSNRSIIEKFDFAGGQGGFAMKFVSNTIRGHIYNGTSDLKCEGTTILPLNTWTHVTVTYNQSTTDIKCYANGQLEHTLTTGFTPMPTTVSLKIGAIGDTAMSSFWQGNIDEATIWSTDLSDSEIVYIYNRQKQKYSGHYDSSIIDLGASGSWTNLNPITTLPFYKELTGASGSESSSDYSLIYSNITLYNNLVGLWRFDEIASSSVNGGLNDIEDFSGSGFHGDASGITYGSEGILSQSALLFGGQVVPNTSGDLTNIFTTSVWVKPYSYGVKSILGSRGPSDFGFNFKIQNSTVIHGVIGDGSGWITILADGTGNFDLGKWHHIVYTVTPTGYSIYANGVLSGSGTYPSDSPILFDSNHILTIGNARSTGGEAFDGEIDEVAIWSRALTATEIQQLYRRGANRIKYQVKSCVDSACKCKSLAASGDDNDCDGDGTPNSSDTSDIHFAQWLGKDGATGESFSELQNCSVIDNTTGDCDTAAMATINTTSANFDFSRYPAPASPANNRYFQYRVLMEAEENTVWSGAPCMPELTSVEVGPTGRYHGGSHTITSVYPVAYSDLTKISFTEAGSCSLTYQLSPDGSTYYYWNGSSWVSASGIAQSSTSTNMSSNIATFSAQTGAGNLYWKAFMNSNTAQSCEIDEVSISVIE